jgi:two-component system response regulator AlgR
VTPPLCALDDLAAPAPGVLRVVLADDEAPARVRLRDLLADCAVDIPNAVVGEAATGRELLDLLQERPADVVLLDIRMPEMDGLEAAQHLQKLGAPPRIVFTTAYDAHAVRAFELRAIDYLLKPIRQRRLFDALTRVRSAAPVAAGVLADVAQRPRSHLSVHDRGRVVLVPVHGVLYLRAETKYVCIRTREREFLVEESLTRLEAEFAGRFVRIHRNCLVATAHLAGFEREAGVDGDGHWVALVRGIDERLPVSRRQAHVVRELGRKYP